MSSDLREDARQRRCQTLATRVGDIGWLLICLCVAATGAHSLALIFIN